MKRNELVVAIVAIVMAFVLSSQAQERPEGGPPVFQPQPGQPVGPDRPFPPIKEYARQLRERAREAQELANRLRREADELDQMARQGPMPMPGMGPGPMFGMGAPQGPMDPRKQELMEIKEAIGRAEKEGRPEKAADLRRRAEQLMKEMGPGERGPQKDDPGLREMKERVERLVDQARDAQAGGREDEARRLREEAESIEVKLQIEREIRERISHVEAMHDKTVALRKQAEQAKRDGHPEEAQAQWEKADEIERQIGQVKQGIERFKLETELKQVLRMAEQAEKGGDVDKAEALTRKARELKDRLGGPGPEHGIKMSHEEEMRRMVDELRQEVKRLRQEMEELRRQGRESR